MNDAGNFLIETCDETVSRELKQQLLLLNGRWRELFVKVKHVRHVTSRLSAYSTLHVKHFVFIPQVRVSFTQHNHNLVFRDYFPLSDLH